MLVWSLRLLFTVIFIAMVSVVSWASLTESILAIPSVVTNDPWFIATMFDAYSGFITFYVWVFYREICWVRKALWLLAILLLGNMAMAAYVLWIVWRAPAQSSWQQLLLRPEHVT